MRIIGWIAHRHFLCFETLSLDGLCYAACRIQQQNPTKIILHLVFASGYALSQTQCGVGQALDSCLSLTRQSANAIIFFSQQRNACDSRAHSRHMFLLFPTIFFSCFLLHRSRHARHFTSPNPATRHKVSHLRQRLGSRMGLASSCL